VDDFNIIRRREEKNILTLVGLLFSM
jgi:hypothetical protein